MAQRKVWGVYISQAATILATLHEECERAPAFAVLRSESSILSEQQLLEVYRAV